MQIPTVQQPSYTTHPIEVYDKRGKFLRKEFIGNDKGIVDHKYIGRHHYAPRGGNSYIDTSYKIGGSFQDYLRQQNKPITENPSTLYQQPTIDEVKKQQALTKQAALYDKTFSKTPLATPASKAKSAQLKRKFVAENPYAKLNAQGEIEAVSPERDLQGNPYNYTQAWRNDDGFKNMMHGVDAAMIATGVGELGVAGGKALAKYATTQTPLKNAWKLNPYAFKPNPEAYYRGIGRSGLDDALESKVLRTANKTGNYGEDLYMTKDFIVAKGTYSRDAPTLTGDSWDFNTWKMSPPKDPKSYIAEIPKNAAPNVENPGSNIYINKGPLPLKDIKLYKENWLQGYKQVEAPKSNFKSEIDWGKWNKEIPDNKALMQEYNAIEQQAKANGSWMKNPDGSKFQGTPEQFVQQNSENFKKAFGDSKLINPDGSYEPVVHSTKAKFDEFDKSYFGQTDEGYHGDGFYFSPIQRTGFEGEFYQRPYKWLDNKTVQGTHNYGKNKMMLYVKPDKIVGGFPVKPYTEIITDLNKPGNIKSATGNNGMFDMTNPNIYKAAIPGLIGAGVLGQKKLGGLPGKANIYQKGGAFDYGFLLEDDEDENQYNKNEAENNDRVTEEDVQEEVAKQSRKLADMEFLFGSNKVRKDRDVNRFDDDYVAPDSSSDGTDWASKFKSVEDPNSKFDHGNGAYGSFGFRKTGHLAEAYKSPEFQEVREQFGDYNSFWNSFKQSGYGPLSKTVDSRYEDWLKRQTGNNISIAGKFNLTGSKSPSSNWMVGNNMLWQGYVNKLNKYKTGGTYSVDNEEIANLIQKGVKFKFV